MLLVMSVVLEISLGEGAKRFIKYEAYVTFPAYL